MDVWYVSVKDIDDYTAEIRAYSALNREIKATINPHTFANLNRFRWWEENGTPLLMVETKFGFSFMEIAHAHTQ